MPKEGYTPGKLFLLRRIINVTKSIILPGFHQLSLYEIAKFFIKEVKDTSLNESAAAVTYNFIMALGPFFLILFSLVPYLPLQGAEKGILDTIKLLTPNASAYNNISTIALDFMHTKHKDILSYGILLTLFFSSNGILGFMRSFDRSMSVYKKRSGLSRRWTAIQLTFVLICVGVATIGVLILQGRHLDKWILKIFHKILLIKLMSFLILFLVVFLAISIIYKYGPSMNERFSFVSTGSVFASIVSMLTTGIFFFLVNHIINYSKVYGSIGSVIAFMVWVWLNTLVILIGYELNVSIMLGKISRTKNGKDKQH